jgi:hypothetical protein
VSRKERCSSNGRAENLLHRQPEALWDMRGQGVESYEVKYDRKWPLDATQKCKVDVFFHAISVDTEAKLAVIRVR